MGGSPVLPKKRPDDVANSVHLPWRAVPGQVYASFSMTLCKDRLLILYGRGNLMMRLYKPSVTQTCPEASIAMPEARPKLEPVFPKSPQVRRRFPLGSNSITR